MHVLRGVVMMNKSESLKCKNAVITGASSGIGRAIALRLAEDKINLALCGRNVERLHSVQNEAELHGVKTILLPGDLEDVDYLSSCIEKAADFFGGLDILINNAGTAYNCSVEETTPEQFDSIMRVNVRAPFLLCQAALKWLRKSDCATIINISSVVSYKGYPNQSAYVASKHAISGFTKSLANEVFRDGIRAHIISPGGVYTDMITTMRPDLSPDGMIMPSDIAEIAAFLIKHRSNAVIDEIRVRREGKEPFA